MSSNSSGRRPRLLPILFAGVLASGGAFFWSNLPSKARPFVGASVAQAAPKATAPKAAAPANPKLRPASKAERAAAQKTISAQLRAFNTGNWKEAVKFQSDGLKGNFDTPEAFGAMIQSAYPVFVRPKKVVYGRAVSIAGHIQFEVTLTGEDDSTNVAVYSLVKEKGNYRVEGVAGGQAQRPANGNQTIT